MPVSGHEETGVKSLAEQFSGLIAGVPIKKRRFPLIQSSSPLSEEPSSLTEETELLRKEQSTSQGSTLSNASIAGAPIKKRRFPLIPASSSPLENPCLLTEENDATYKEHSRISQGSDLSTRSSGYSDRNGNPAFEERKASSDVTDANMVQSNSNYLRPKIEEPNLATHSSTLDVVDSKEKVVINESYDEKLGPQMMKGNPELLLAAKDSLALNIGADISKQNVEEKLKQENPAVPESPNLSLGLKEQLFPAGASLDIDKSFRKIEKAESVSLKLSLGKEEGGTKRLNGDAKTNSHTTCTHSNRAKWDLNTTMDAWEESGNDATSGKTSIDGLKITCSALNEKHFMCSTGMESTGSASLKQNHAESRNKAFIISSRLYGQQYKCVDPCNLCLTSCLQKYAEEPSRLSVKLDSDSAATTVSLSNVVASGDVNIASLRRVKSEPFDENPKHDLKEAKPCPLGSLDVTVKHEIVERSNVESFKSSSGRNLKLFDLRLIKSEPGHENNQERPKTKSKSDQMARGLPQGSDNCSAIVKRLTLETMPISAETACLPVKPMCSAEPSTSECIVNHLENSACTEGARVDEKLSQGASASAKQATLGIVTSAMVAIRTESNGSGMKDSIRTGEEIAYDPDGCSLKLLNEFPSDPQGRGEGCLSDDEKITLSADLLEDDSYGFDYESDDTHSLTVAMDKEHSEEDDDYEDGEVREPLEHSTVEDTICEVREVERHDCSSHENELIEKEVMSGDCPASSHFDENDYRTVTYSEINCGKDGVDIELNEKSDIVTDKIVCLQESLDAEKPIVGSDGKRPVRVLQRKSLDLSERKNDPKASETELSFDQGTSGSHGVDIAQYADEAVKNLDMVGKTDSDLAKMEASVNTDDATKDVSGGGGGRIINLSLAARASSPGKSKSISGRALPTRATSDVLSEAVEGDKLHRGRDEVYINIDGPSKFSRERHQDMSPRNSRLNFVRGRGRVNSRLDSHRGEWESDREFAGEFYNGPGEFYNGPNQFRAPRLKYASAIPDTDLDYNNVAPDGSYVGNSRVGRKPLNEGPLCRHIASRRRSPGGRENIQMAHRIPRTISPSRCIGGDGSELVGMRHSEKFMRGFPQDPIDPMFTRPQPFEGLDGRFTRGSRNFSTIQRRGLPRIHSKSPIRSSSHSSGPWSSPRRRSPRRSPDGFGGHPELAHRRSPFYRVDRMRSPNRPVFPGERVIRRHVSPSYMSRPSNDVRDIDSGREHGHPRSFTSNRGPSGRILLRNRRFDVVDSRDRADNDEYFGGAMHSGRLLELSGEANGERRRFVERRGPIRSFRPPYDGTVGENFHLDAEDGPRHYGFCTDDADFHGRGNLRERDFDRRIKSRPANVPPRRTRNIDEQEANYRPGGQVWSEGSFDDISRVKKKRF